MTPAAPAKLKNFINGQYCDPTSPDAKYLAVTTPHTGESFTQCPISSEKDVQKAVDAAKKAFPAWSNRTSKDRVQILLRYHALVNKYADELAEIIVKEHGKNKAEALAEVAKGNETVEYACAIPELIGGRILEVSRGVTCHDTRYPLGVVACIVPFNFPFMVPHWTLPIALATGNCVIIKPSEKVPWAMYRVMEILKEAGIPDGVVNLVNGAVNVVNAICDSPDIKAVSFVGSSKIAELVYKRCKNAPVMKKCLALGGAKNHLVSMPDCDIQMCSQDILNSFTGCCGQRCMAASVLLTVGKQQALLDAIIEKAKKLKPGSQPGQVGPVIDQASLDRINHYITTSLSHGAKLLLDGRSWATPSSPTKKTQSSKGFFIGPTILLHTSLSDPSLHDEIFGPVLSVYECKNVEEAIKIENENKYGNAACVYTMSGYWAEWFSKRFSAGMCGVNIGVPVPREPFSFGGINASKFGDMDITGDGGLEFFTYRKKVTTKWSIPEERSWLN
ncbi:Aldehyde/histidinol dehydrogenase [Paraphysoderma sedebokerense]|nr:Aldehyde/histidinol dehydrogenase [Paraphysoderma sedebokerense]